MCHLMNCFTWAFDIVQRTLTFILALITCLAILIGITACVMAGIAYGYNYSLSEFLTFGRSDVTVYVRRGQFDEGRQELPFNFRRSGGDNADDDRDLFVSNSSADYETPNVESNAKELSNSWKMAQDTRNYAHKLTKYEGMKPGRRAEEIDNIADVLSNTLDPIFPYAPKPAFGPTKTSIAHKPHRTLKAKPYETNNPKYITSEASRLMNEDTDRIHEEDTDYQIDNVSLDYGDPERSRKKKRVAKKNKDKSSQIFVKKMRNL